MRNGKPSILPRLAAHSHGADAGRRRQRIPWRRYAILIVLALMVLVFLTTGRVKVQTVPSMPDRTGSGHGIYDEETRLPIYVPAPTKPPKFKPPQPPKQPVKPPPPSTPAKTSSSTPASFETDPDPSKTTRCTTAYTPSQKLVQFALMIDAGSTGSRIHIYKFNNCGASPDYEYEVFKMIRPGLSSYAGDSTGAATSLDELLDLAMKVVPKELTGCTPVAVKATAGLRALGPEKSADILNAVATRISAKYPFQLVEKDGVVIMDGKDEGVYAWITANYLLNTIRRSTPADVAPYAVLELGGGSTQIVFEPVFPDTSSRLEEGEHKYDLLFAGKDHTLYQHSYLGYGLMSARKSVHRLVEFMHFGTQGPNTEIPNPCLARGTKRVVEVEIGRGEIRQPKNVTMVGEDVGSFEACERVIQLVMAKHAMCKVKPCSFNGVYQPSLLSTFPTGKILLLSYFYDRISPLYPNRSTLNISTIAKLASWVCEGQESWETYWGSDKNAMEELEGRPEYCLDLTFMYTLLRLGYEFTEDREVRIEKQVDHTELGWCLGATISLLDGHLTCRE